jgi:hypothetical protein
MVAFAADFRQRARVRPRCWLLFFTASGRICINKQAAPGDSLATVPARPTPKGDDVSQMRKKLFESQKERIEMAAVVATERRKGEPFVVLVLELQEPLAKRIAATKCSPEELERQSSTPGAVAIMDTSYADAGVYFEHLTNWAKAKSTPLTNGSFVVAIIGDGGVSFVSHRVPT